MSAILARTSACGSTSFSFAVWMSGTRFSGHGFERLCFHIGPWQGIVDLAVEMAVDDLCERVGEIDGSAPLSLQVSTSEAMTARFSLPPSDATL